MKKGDRYLLCSDGLTKHTEDYEFQEMLGNGTAEEICTRNDRHDIRPGCRR